MPAEGASREVVTVVLGRDRAVAAAVFAACVVVLCASAWLNPDPRGLGTHEQLGWAALPPCGMPLRWGIPCPTCGMCTAFAHTVRGELWSALRVQPAGFLLALATFAACVGSARVLWTGDGAWIRRPGLFRTDRLIAIGLFFLAAWAYKVAVVLIP